MHIIYVLESGVDCSWYIGYTTNLRKRIVDHNQGKNISTRSKKPWKLIYAELYLHKQDALGREKFLKSGSGRMFIKKQLRNYLAT